MAGVAGLPRFAGGQLRIVLAIMVVISHLSDLEIGRVAVVLFFLLSGFWVVEMYRRKYSAMAAPILDFYASRLFRIFPTYLIVLGLSVAACAALGRPTVFGISDFILFGLDRAHTRVLSPAWSLDIELQFYLLVPFLYRLMGNAPSRGRIALLVAAAIVVTAMRWGIGVLPGTILSYAAAFAIGAAISFARATASGRAAALSLALFVGAAALMLIVPAMQWMIAKNNVYHPVDRDVVALVWGALLVPFVVWTVRRPSGRFDRHLGDLAFTLYLCHWFFVLNFALFDDLPAGPLRMAGCAAAIAATALVIYFLFERPIEALRHRLLAPRLPGGAAR